MKKEYKDKFIGFVDILGWKEKVELSEQGTELSLDELVDLLNKLGTSQDKMKFKKSGPIVCPNSRYITRGKIYHTDGQVLIGSGYQEALKKEQNVSAFKHKANEKGTPFVEVDPTVCDYIETCEDSCVKKMFNSYVKDDRKVRALFPFKRLQHSFMIIDWMGHKFDPEKEHKSIDNIGLMIMKMKEGILSYVDKSNQKAVNKVDHYIKALDKQLAECEKTEELINKFHK